MHLRNHGAAEITVAVFALCIEVTECTSGKPLRSIPFGKLNSLSTISSVLSNQFQLVFWEYSPFRRCSQ